MKLTMKNLIKTYEMLINNCEEEIELNGLRSIPYELWLKGNKDSYKKILNAINEGKTIERLIRKSKLRIMMNKIILEYCNLDENTTVAHTAYVRGLLIGYTKSLSHIQNYE